MRNRLVVGLLSLALVETSFANQTIQVQNNAEFALSLSQSNYNRLVVRGDKIVEAVFPEGAMGVKRDEQDGSVYIMLTSQSPFTLFVATEAGRHFSVTMKGEESLGKTVELVPNAAVVKAQTQPPLFKANQTVANAGDEQTLVSLINHMETNKPLSGFTVKKKRLVERWQKGFTLIHNQTWQGSELAGEIVELYNGGHKPLSLDEAWFNQDTTRALKLSQKQLLPKQTAYLYRVSADPGAEVNHG